MRRKLFYIGSVLLLACILSGVFAWTTCSRGFVQSLESSAEAAAARSNNVVNISALTDFRWDTLYIYHPYTGVDEIHAQLGYKWADAQTTGIDLSETFYLFVFVRDGKVVRHYKFSRRIGDFEDLDGHNSFKPEDAEFEVIEVNKDGVTRLRLIPKLWKNRVRRAPS